MEKVDKYWAIWGKITLAIIIILLIFYFIPFGEEITYEKRDPRITDLNESNYDLIKIRIDLAEESGYEVLHWSYFDYGEESLHSAYIKMKSMGSRNTQVWDGLFDLAAVYPNAPNYEIIIIEPTQTCFYQINTLLWKGYMGVEEYTFEGETLDTLDFYNMINTLIEETTCY